MMCKSHVPAIIYMKIYLAYEEHVYKRPIQHNVSMANALKRCTYSFYSDVVECLPVDPATWVRFPAGAGKIFSLYDIFVVAIV